MSLAGQPSAPVRMQAAAFPNLASAIPHEKATPPASSLARHDVSTSDAMDIQVSRGTENPPTKTARAPGIVFHARSELDVQPRPRLAPDTSKLDDLSWSGVPLRIRLFIDARGAVVDAVILQSRDEPKVNALVSEMFLETGFVPGRIGTQDVASYKDIELGVGPPR